MIFACSVLIPASWFLVPLPAQAQTFYDVIHRPPRVKYDVLQTEHFELIFQRGLDTTVYQAALTLEDAYRDIRAETGFDRQFRMPVVLNDYSDVSNGFVIAAPFRQEITAAPIKGKVLSPRHSDWLHQVLPHEMVHAAQAEFKGGFGIGAILSVFSRDLERALNLGIPSGMTEGLAVVHESSESKGYGRLNFSMTRMQYRAAAAAGEPWDIGQLLDPPAYTRPFDRYYTGGGMLTRFLEDSVRTGFFTRSLGFYNRTPFFGYGAALWYGTGKGPWDLNSAFERATVEAEFARIAGLGELTDHDILTDERGLSCRRPRWTGKTAILTHCSSYRVAPGFYAIDVDERKLERRFGHAITEDFFYSVDPDLGRMGFSRYHPELMVTVSSQSKLHLLDLATGVDSLIDGSDRFYAPVLLRDGRIWALRDNGQFNEVWEFSRRSGSTRIFGEFGTTIREMAVGPDGRVAVLANRSGEQAIYLFAGDAAGWSLRPVVASWDAAIYDPVWTPDGSHILFASDPSGVSNIYAVSPGSGQVRRLTNVRFGAFEPDVSPDGLHLAFVHYAHEQYQLAVMDLDLDGAGVASGFGLPEMQRRDPEAIDAATRDSLVAETRPYRPFPRFLVPRALAPFVRFDEETLDAFDNDLDLGLSLTLAGADPLQQWAYSATGFYESSRIWGRATVANATNVLRPFIRLLNEPITQNVAVDDSTIARVVREERAVRLGTTLPLRFSRNVHTTSLVLGFSGDYRLLRVIDDESNPLADFSRRLTVTPTAVFGYRLQGNIRDIVPNSGLLIGSVAEIDALVSDEGLPSRAWRTDLNWYLPFLKSHNQGIRVIGGILWQNRGSIVSTETFVPRGYEDDLALGAGTFVKAGLEFVQPLFYLDRGLILIPVTFEAIYAYGFGESVADWSDFDSARTSAGIGIGARLRLFHNLRVDARIALARLLEEDRWEVSYR